MYLSNHFRRKTNKKKQNMIYIYIYIIIIIIIIITVLIVTKSLCGFVANQVQYNMESAQYLGYSYYIIIIINKYILDLYT